MTPSTTQHLIDRRLASLGINASTFQRRLDALLNLDAPRLGRLWSYYRNPASPGADNGAMAGPYRQAQEWGLPRRIKGDDNTIDTPRREVVIENDIAWRIDAMVDFLFGKPITLTSAATDPARREQINELLRAIIANHGGLVFLQQLAVLGAVYGYVDVLVKLLPAEADAAPMSAATRGELAAKQVTGSGHKTTTAHAPNDLPAEPPVPRLDDDERTPGAITTSLKAMVSLARRVRFEIVEPARALPVLSPTDFSLVEAYAQVYRVDAALATSRNTTSDAQASSWFRRLFSGQNPRSEIEERITVVDLITSDEWMTIHNDRIVASGRNSLGRIPLVHVQNVALPFSYAGASDVEPLLPLQDELNTRLSDRAHRIAMQSFKMYLGKGIDGFAQQSIAPGRLWASDDPEAHIIEFGGDAPCPSEDAHIRDLREAMDKHSGVSPIAAGAIKGRIGRLTSAAALRVTMLSLLARTERKRTAYGAGLAQMCELALAWLDRAGLFHTTEDERPIEIQWPNPIPLNEIERLDEAHKKLALGVPREVVLKELGYE